MGSYGLDELKATLELDAPNDARALPTTKELIAWLESIAAPGASAIDRGNRP